MKRGTVGQTGRRKGGSRESQTRAERFCAAASTLGGSTVELRELHCDTQGILERSQRSAYFRAMSVTSAIKPFSSVRGSKPKLRKRSLTTCRSFSSASLRGFFK